MENTWPSDEAYFPISDFALITPLIMAGVSVIVIAYNMLCSHTKTLDFHLQYQKQAGTMPAAYCQSNLSGDLKKCSEQVASSNIIPAIGLKGNSASLKTDMSLLSNPNSKLAKGDRGSRQGGSKNRASVKLRNKGTSKK